MDTSYTLFSLFFLSMNRFGVTLAKDESLDCTPCLCEYYKNITYGFVSEIWMKCEKGLFSTIEFAGLPNFNLRLWFSNIANLSFDSLPVKKRQLTLAMGISNCTVADADLSAFQNLRILNVTNVTVAGNSTLKTIPPTLLFMNVSNSTLTGLEFIGSSSLVILDASSNHLQEIITLPHLRYLNLADNRIEHFAVTNCSMMMNMTYLNLRGNIIYEVPKDAFTCMLPKDNNFDKGISMDLSWNRIQTIHKEAFHGLNMYKIDLSHNLISSLHSNQFRWLRLNYTNLQFNPWRCNCDAQWMLDDLLPLLHTTQPEMLAELRCATPRIFKKKQLSDWFNMDDAFCEMFTFKLLTEWWNNTFPGILKNLQSTDRLNKTSDAFNLHEFFQNHWLLVTGVLVFFIIMTIFIVIIMQRCLYKEKLCFSYNQNRGRGLGPNPENKDPLIDCSEV